MTYVFVACLSLCSVFVLSMFLTFVSGTLALGIVVGRFKLPSLETLVPVGVLCLFGIVTGGIADKLLSVCLLLIFMAANQVGVKALKVIGIASLIGSISVIVVCTIRRFVPNGGLYDLYNYNLATGAIVIGSLLWQHKYRWLTVSVSLISLAFTGAAEALIVVAVLLVTAIVRRDYDKRFAVACGVGVSLICVLFFATSLWHNTIVATTDGTLDGRTGIYTASIASGVMLFGHGTQHTNLAIDSIHSVPLRVLYETGPAGLLCWLWLVVRGIWKTSWKYVWVSIAALSLFDHFLWTQLATYFFFVCGLPNSNSNDLVFKATR